MMFNECGDCTVCCSGKLIGTQYGNTMGLDKPCVFLIKQKCSIYENRPNHCHKYQCAWSQQLFPEWMRPDKCGVLISVEVKNNQQILKIIGKPTDDVLIEITNFAERNKCHVEYL